MRAGDQGNYLRAVGLPAGGTYAWTSTTDWTGTGRSPLFYCTTTSMGETATVTYTHPEHGSAQATSASIHIFDAELTLDGLDDEDEESPGGRSPSAAPAGGSPSH